jgi:hypothetical protein
MNPYRARAARTGARRRPRRSADWSVVAGLAVIWALSAVRLGVSRDLSETEPKLALAMVVAVPCVAFALREDRYE